MSAPVTRHSVYALDLARASAALAVLVDHVRDRLWVKFSDLPGDQHTPLVGAFFALTRLGREAVVVFFVLSGFLVGGRMLKRLQQGSFDLTSYAVDRAARIYLPLVPACLLTLLIGGVVFGQSPNVFQLLAALAGLNDVVQPTLPLDPPLWSLGYEIWFYVLAGAVGALVMRRHILLSFAIAAAAVLVFTAHASPYLFYWWFGALAVFVLDIRFAWMLAAGGAVMVLAGIGCRPSHALSDALCDAFVAVGFTGLLPWLSRPGVNRALRPLAGLGGMLAAFSYTLYLTHYPILKILWSRLPRAPRIDLASMALFLAEIVLCLGVAVILYAAFERHTGFVRRAVGRFLDGRGVTKMTRQNSAGSPEAPRMTEGVTGPPPL